MLKVNDINVYYGAIHAIKGVSFQVIEGEVVTLIGANGAGKSPLGNDLTEVEHTDALADAHDQAHVVLNEHSPRGGASSSR